MPGTKVRRWTAADEALLGGMICLGQSFFARCGVVRLAASMTLCDSSGVQTVQLEEAAAHLPELVEDVALGKEVVIARGTRAVAKLVAPDQTQGRPRFGSAQDKITFHPGWDEPCPGFEEYKTDAYGLQREW